MSNFYTEHDKLRKRIEDLGEKMSPAQNELLDILCADEVFDTYPPNFFKEHKIDWLNEHFGAHDGLALDEQTYEYMVLMQKFDAELEEMVQTLGEWDEKESKDVLKSEEKEDAEDVKLSPELRARYEELNDSEKALFVEKYSESDMTPYNWVKENPVEGVSDEFNALLNDALNELVPENLR